MKIYSPKPEPPEQHCIMAQKILDQCRFSEITEQGPVVSDERCTCIIVQQDRFGPARGRLVVPGRPIHLPEQVKQICYVEDSFLVKSIKILDVEPEHPEEAHPTRWKVSIEFTFRFRLQFLNPRGTPMEILCKCGKAGDPYRVKYDLCCTSTYCMEKRMYSPPCSESILAGDLFSPADYHYFNAPHVIAETKAKPVEFKAFCPYPEGCCDIYDDIYCEPYHLIFAYIDMCVELSLFKFSNLQLTAAHCCKPNPKQTCMARSETSGKKGLFPFLKNDL